MSLIRKGAVLTVTASDEIGNESDPTSVTVIWYDRVAQETMYYLNPAVSTNGWYSSDFLVTLVGRDRESGIAKTEYRIAGGDWITFSQPITISAEGENPIEFRSVDVAGNEEEVNSFVVKIDRTPTDLNITLSHTTLLPANNKISRLV